MILRFIYAELLITISILLAFQHRSYSFYLSYYLFQFSIRMLNYCWSRWTKIFSRNNPYPTTGTYVSTDERISVLALKCTCWMIRAPSLCLYVCMSLSHRLTHSLTLSTHLPYHLNPPLILSTDTHTYCSFPCTYCSFL